MIDQSDVWRTQLIETTQMPTAIKTPHFINHAVPPVLEVPDSCYQGAIDWHNPYVYRQHRQTA